ncbi:MAG: hypothetical protein E6Q97_07085 [Desulfurellales bacterium]|nr:MAG: hypothetical protein E6Q97_07085 [Desulfurellales bacterium]
MPGLIVNGVEVAVSGATTKTGELMPAPIVRNYRDDAALTLPSRSYGRRRRQIGFAVLHTTKGYPDHTMTSPQYLRDGIGTSRINRVIDNWAEGDRVGGAGIVIDADGVAYCLCDLAKFAAYHCVGMNQISIGIEVVQQDDASLYRCQLDTLACVVETLTTTFSLPRVVAMPYRGCRVELDDGAYASGLDGIGVVGHRDCSDNRGFGDPGDFCMEAVERLTGWGRG